MQTVVLVRLMTTERYRVVLPVEATNAEIVQFLNALPIYFTPGTERSLTDLPHAIARWLVRDDLEIEWTTGETDG